jgi:hypothetical protein
MLLSSPAMLLTQLAMNSIIVDIRKHVIHCLGHDSSKKSNTSAVWVIVNPTALIQDAGNLTSIPRVPNLRISAELPQINTMTPQTS